jgi:hypothetical protein
MRGMLQATLAVALLFLIQQSTAQAQSTSTYNASGAYAESFFTANNSSVTLFAARGCPALPCSGSNGTIIVWFAFNTNPDGTHSFTEGDGVIPDSAFQVSGLKHMSLNVDTSQVAGFKTMTCTFVPGGWTCSNGPFGVMQADWEATEQSSSTNKEDTTTTIGPFTTKTKDDQAHTSGGATGTFLGTAFSDNSRTTLGTNKSHTKSMTKPQ